MRKMHTTFASRALVAMASAASLAVLPACSMPWDAPAQEGERWSEETEGQGTQGNNVVYSSDTYKEPEGGDQDLEFTYRIALLSGYWTGNPDPSSYAYRAVYVLEAPQKGFSYVLEGRLPDGRSVTLNRDVEQEGWRVRRLEDTYTPGTAASKDEKQDSSKGTAASAAGTTDAGASGPAGGAVMTDAAAGSARPWVAGDEKPEEKPAEKSEDKAEEQAPAKEESSLASNSGSVSYDPVETPKQEEPKQEEKKEDDESASAAKSASRKVNDGSGVTMLQQVFVVESRQPFEASQMSFSFSEMMRWTEKMDPIFAKLSDPGELTFNNAVTDASGQGIHGSLVLSNGTWLWVRRGKEESGGNLPQDASKGTGAEVRGYETYRLTPLSRLAHEDAGLLGTDPASVAMLWDTALRGCSFMLARGSDSSAALPVPNKKGVEAFSEVAIGSDEYGVLLNVSIGLKGPDTSLTKEVYEEYVGRRGTKNSKAYCAVMSCDGKAIVIG